MVRKGIGESRGLHWRGGNGQTERGPSWDWLPFLLPGFIFVLLKIISEGGGKSMKKEFQNTKGRENFSHFPLIFYSKQYSIISKNRPPFSSNLSEWDFRFGFYLFFFPNVWVDLNPSLSERKDTEGPLYRMISSKRRWRQKLFADVTLNLKPMPSVEAMSVGRACIICDFNMKE